jgi:hypothetical protein
MKTKAKDCSGTYWSTWRDSKLVDLEQTGHVHVGACFCNSKNDDASKHWLCVQTIDRQGTWIRRVDNGHFNDMTLDVATMSESWARFFTRRGSLSGYFRKYLSGGLSGYLLSRITCSLEMSFRVCSWLTSSSTGCNWTRLMSAKNFCRGHMYQYHVNLQIDATEIYLLRQCVSHNNIVCIIRFLANVIRDICRLSRSRSILQPSKICLDFIQVRLQLHLVWKCDIGLGI